MFRSRLATPEDLPALRELIHVSIRDLVSQFLDSARVEASFEIMGEPLYLASGYSVVERVEIPTSKGVGVPCARMRRRV